MLMNNACFGKTMESVRKQRDIKLVTMKEEGTVQYQNQIFILQSFHEKLLAIEMEKTEILLNKLVCLRLSILELSKILMYEFWYDYVKQNMMKNQN